MKHILLKDILIETKLYAYSTEELLQKILKFDGKTLVFLDTEATGIDPNDFYVQLTQIALLVVDGSTMEAKEEFATKVELNDTLKAIINDPQSPEAIAFEKENQRHIKKYKKPESHPSELLKMTGYHDGDNSKLSEELALKKVEEILKKYPNVILIAHNASYDMKMIESRRRVLGMTRMPKYPVIDTIAISRYFFVPVLVALENDEEAKRFLDALLAKTKYRSYTTALGKLANVFGIESKNWHDASADVHMLFAILKKMIEYLSKNKNLNARKYKGVMAKRHRNQKF